VNRLNAEIVKVLRSPEIVEKLAQQGVDPVGNTPAEFAQIIRADIDKWAKVIKEAGIRAD
jgi:tripartite-type tricarboxylate transporter receptor subunit TctC